MPASTEIPGSCNLCQGTVPGNRTRRHLLRCIEANTGRSPSRDPGRRDRRRTALKTAYIPVRSREQPHRLECCGHLSHFRIGGVTHSVAVPRPGDRWRFDPMDGEEAAWRHMGRSVNAVILLLAKFEHEFGYGRPTGLVLEQVGMLGELVQWIAPSQPWHGGKIVILARNGSLRPACAVGARPGGRPCPGAARTRAGGSRAIRTVGALLSGTCWGGVSALIVAAAMAAVPAGAVPVNPGMATQQSITRAPVHHCTIAPTHLDTGAPLSQRPLL